jgi:NADPH:quinone reductase-like Zn-dependent oxidoreductase
MRAIIQPRYGGPESVELAEVPTPSPKAGEVLVGVRSSSVNGADVEILDGFPIIRMTAPFRPANRIAGTDVAGVVERTGPGVTDLHIGDEVMGDLSEHGGGGFAEYAVAPVEAVCRIPRGLTLEDAGAIPTAAWVAIKAAREIEADSRVLINGAGGSMGIFTLQMAKARGAHVTGVDTAAKLELLRSLGADEVIDYQAEDVTHSDERWDVVLDVFARRSLSDWRRILSPTGKYRMVGGSARRIFAGFVRGRMMSSEGGQDLGLLFGWPHTRQDMDEVNALIEGGRLRPVIGSRYPLEEAAVALRELKEGRVLGKAMLDITA